MSADNFLSLDTLAAVAESLRGESRTIVLCHGMFDLIRTTPWRWQRNSLTPLPNFP